MYNQSISLETPLTVTDVVHTKCCQKKLSSNIEDVQFKCLLNKSSLADMARLLSVSAPHSFSWLSMIPTPGQCLHLDPVECHIAIKWWLGMDTSAGSQCSLCYDHSLDPLGQHATTCKRGGDVVIRHNNIRDILAESFRRAGISVQCEAGSGLSHDNRHTRPADILVPNWFCSRPAALDLTVISPLNSKVIAEAGFTGGSAAASAEVRKHIENDPKCEELGWICTCVPLAVEAYGAWGIEAQCTISRLARRLCIKTNQTMSRVISNLYGRLNMSLIKANSRAMLSRSAL